MNKLEKCWMEAMQSKNFHIPPQCLNISCCGKTDRSVFTIKSPKSFLSTTIEMLDYHNGFCWQYDLDIDRNYDPRFPYKSSEEFYSEDSVIWLIKEEYKQMELIERERIEEYYSKHYFFIN